MKTSDTRSPNLGLTPAVKTVAMLPVLTGKAVCPFQLDVCGYNYDQPKQIFPESLGSIEEVVIWRYVVAGSLTWDEGKTQLRLGPEAVLATHQPAPSRLRISREGACVLWVVLIGKASIGYFDHIVSRFGPSHRLAPDSRPVRLAEELVHRVRAREAHTPFFWAERCYEWLSAYHEALEAARLPLRRLATREKPPVRLLPELPRTVKSFAAQLGYSPAHFSRQLTKKWRASPGKLLRDLRLREASQQLVQTSDSVQVIAARVGYASVPAFITAFKRCHGVTPLAYRHQKR